MVHLAFKSKGKDKINQTEFELSLGQVFNNPNWIRQFCHSAYLKEPDQYSEYLREPFYENVKLTTPSSNIKTPRHQKKNHETWQQ
jgi:hypothetical protein